MGKRKIDLEILQELPPWEWPEGTRDVLLDVLRDRSSSEAELLVAAEFAGDCTVLDEELVGALLSILRSGDRPEELRARAAIALGPILELADTDGFEEVAGLPISHSISEPTFHGIQTTMRELYQDSTVPTVVRRRVLEASVRAPQDWHEDAIRTAYAANDDQWRLTAVFCMEYIRGFEEQILEALGSDDPETHYHAVVAAGNWEVARAWKHVVAIVTSEEADRDLLIAAIHAVVGIRPDEAETVLGDLLDSDDEEIVDEVHEAFTMAGLFSGLDDPDDDDLF